MKKWVALLLVTLMAVSVFLVPALAEGEAEPQYGGTYKFAMFYVTTTFFTPKGSGSMKYFVTPSIEPLAREETDGTITPFLAEKFTCDKDALTMQIKLREGIKFHDGSELNAEVLKWNLDYAIGAGKAASLKEGVELAAKTIDNGDAYKKMEEFVSLTNK